MLIHLPLHLWQGSAHVHTKPDTMMHHDEIQGMLLVHAIQAYQACSAWQGVHGTHLTKTGGGPIMRWQAHE